MQRIRHFVTLFALLLVTLPAAAEVDVSDKLERADGKLKVFILAGQSNMQGSAHQGTFAAMGDNPATAPLLAEILRARIERQPPVSKIDHALEQSFRLHLFQYLGQPGSQIGVPFMHIRVVEHFLLNGQFSDTGILKFRGR